MLTKTAVVCALGQLHRYASLNAQVCDTNVTKGENKVNNPLPPQKNAHSYPSPPKKNTSNQKPLILPEQSLRGF